MYDNTYLSPEEFHREKQYIYDEIKYIFDNSRSISEYKTKTKSLRKRVRNNKSLMSYFDTIRERFRGYLIKRNLERVQRQYDRGVSNSIKSIFREASGLHNRGAAFEQGNYKCSTKIIYIAKKN